MENKNIDNFDKFRDIISEIIDKRLMYLSLHGIISMEKQAKLQINSFSSFDYTVRKKYTDNIHLNSIYYQSKEYDSLKIIDVLYGSMYGCLSVIAENPRDKPYYNMKDDYWRDIIEKRLLYSALIIIKASVFSTEHQNEIKKASKELSQNKQDYEVTLNQTSIPSNKFSLILLPQSIFNDKYSSYFPNSKVIPVEIKKQLFPMPIKKIDNRFIEVKIPNYEDCLANYFDSNPGYWAIHGVRLQAVNFQD